MKPEKKLPKLFAKSIFASICAQKKWPSISDDHLSIVIEFVYLTSVTSPLI